MALIFLHLISTRFVRSTRKKKHHWKQRFFPFLSDESWCWANLQGAGYAQTFLEFSPPQKIGGFMMIQFDENFSKGVELKPPISNLIEGSGSIFLQQLIGLVHEGGLVKLDETRFRYEHEACWRVPVTCPKDAILKGSHNLQRGVSWYYTSVLFSIPKGKCGFN